MPPCPVPAWNGVVPPPGQVGQLTAEDPPVPEISAVTWPAVKLPAARLMLAVPPVPLPPSPWLKNTPSPVAAEVPLAIRSRLSNASVASLVAPVRLSTVTRPPSPSPLRPPALLNPGAPPSPVADRVMRPSAEKSASAA